MSTPYDKLPGGLKQLFSPRPGLRFLPAHDVAPEDRRTARITGVAAYLPALEAKVVAAKQSEAKELEPGDEGYEPPPTESWLEKRDNAAVKNQEHRKWMLTDGVKDLYKPSEDPTITADPFRTLFIARLSFDTVKDDLIREFERFGPVDRVKIVYNKGPTESEMLAKGVDRNKIAKKKRSGASQGYGFVMFKREDDMKAAYKEMDGVVIKGRRILVDVERGRTVANWKPKRFGGGLGGRHYTRVIPPRPGGFGFGGPPSGPGFRGGGFGGRGGFRGDGGFRGRGGGGFRGGRGGLGFQNGFPDNAPMGPRGGYQGGYGGRGGGYGGGDRGGGDRGYDRGPRNNANYEPLPPRGGGSYRDRDDRGGGGGGGGGYGGGGGRKRPYDDGPGGGGGYGGYDSDSRRPRY